MRSKGQVRWTRMGKRFTRKDTRLEGLHAKSHHFLTTNHMPENKVVDFQICILPYSTYPLAPFDLSLFPPFREPGAATSHDTSA